MANSKFEYVKAFEQPDTLLQNTWVVVRIDGRGFTKLCAKYAFEKPNDKRALDLMNAAARAVMTDLPDITIAYGVSDEYSFVFHKSYAPLTLPLPSFDGRAVCYPSVQNLRDYMSWRQVDCHINNLYNTTFWALIQLGGMDNRAAEELLAGTVSGDKNEILFSRFHINYNNEPEMYKKGSVVFRDYELVEPGTHNVQADADAIAEPVSMTKSQTEKDKKRRNKARIVIEHLDIIKDDFWDRRPWLLSNKPGKAPKET
ncbi:hypothetical protein VD0004_g6862 [Verticillium dahliae]|uniref:tRNA(His) guanylyltransferase n=1 Tax=Verticillium dahliae TaxID=27337 RepID=A0A444S0P4_VERDA|nr:hypothetical protein BJF96_g647 [Verticillium dahliae]PNH40076.1 hypothetical protein VD0004_g6862 [Verticillium dahliae]RXG46960.1 hypothetical protein VDGE_06112 [Verticillium dahliae]